MERHGRERKDEAKMTRVDKRKKGRGSFVGDRAKIPMC
jgi:hypothetical protein